jgi:hypothetical protein
MPCANEQALHKALQNNQAHARDPHEPAHLRRRSNRALTLIAAILLIITALSGSIDGLKLANNIDAFWLLEIQTDNFEMINLQTNDLTCSAIIAILTLMIAFSSVGLLLGAPRKRPTSLSSKAKNQEPVHEIHGT